MPGHHSCMGRHASFTAPGALTQYAPDIILRPVHMDISLKFDVSEQRLWGKVVLEIACDSLAPARQPKLTLNAVGFQDVHICDPAEGPESDAIIHRYDGTTISVIWKEGWSRGMKRQLLVSYSVHDPVGGLYFSRPDEQYSDRPIVVCTDHESERARYWLPCVDYPTVRTTLAFHLTVPTTWTVLANGVLVDEPVNADGTKTSNWRLDFPCPSYLICFAAGDLFLVEDRPAGAAKIPVAYAGFKGIAPEDVKLTLKETPDMIDWMEKRLGVPMPFPKFYQMLIPLLGSNAMENISLVTIFEELLLDPILATEYKIYMDVLILHEMAHSYFGDLVVCRFFEHSWLKESWATYMEIVWLQDKGDTDLADWFLLDFQNAYFAEADGEYMRPIVTRTYDSSWDLFDAHLYPGGAARLHMLRNKLGEEAFWAGVTSYLQTFARETAETDDFRKCLEKSSGFNLTKFFDQWLYSKGYPKVKGSFDFDIATGVAVVTLEQTQDAELPIFDIEVEVELLAGPAGEPPKKQTAVITFESAGVPVRRAAATFRDLSGPVQQVWIDPAKKVLMKLEFNPGQDLLINSLTAPTLNVRIWAASELIKAGTVVGLNKVKDAMLKELCPQVRLEVAKVLGQQKTSGAVAVLAALLANETHPHAMAPMAEAAGQMRDPLLRQALLDLVARPTLPYRAKNRALEALGAQRGCTSSQQNSEAANLESDLTLLSAHLGDNSGHGLVCKGAFKGIGNLRTRAAYEALKARLEYGRAILFARPFAVGAFAAVARWQDEVTRKEAISILTDLLRDPIELVRIAACAALESLEATSAASAIENMKTTLPAQLHARLDKKVSALRKAGDMPKIPKLQSDVEELQSKIRKLEEKLQDLAAKAVTAAPPTGDNTAAPAPSAAVAGSPAVAPS